MPNDVVDDPNAPDPGRANDKKSESEELNLNDDDGGAELELKDEEESDQQLGQLTTSPITASTSTSKTLPVDDSTVSGKALPAPSGGKTTSETVGSLDLTKDDAGKPVTPTAAPTTTTYDPAEDQETARASIAYILLGMLGTVLVLAFFLLWAKPYHSEKLVTLLQIVFGPIIALVGAATGYYFGAASAQAKK